MAVLDKTGGGTIAVLNLTNEPTKKLPVPLPGTDAIFFAGLGNVLCRAEDKVRWGLVLMVATFPFTLSRVYLLTM